MKASYFFETLIWLLIIITASLGMCQAMLSSRMPILTIPFVSIWFIILLYLGKPQNLHKVGSIFDPKEEKK